MAAVASIPLISIGVSPSKIEVDVDDCFDVDVLCNAVVTAGEVEVNTIIENKHNLTIQLLS